MSLFDYIRSSYNLGKDFTNVELYTKDLGQTMTHHWIDPSGQLFVIDDRNVYDILDNPSFANKAKDRWMDPFIYVPNGNHGKISPLYVTKTIVIYSPKWEGEDYADWPECKIQFKQGTIQEFTYDTKAKRFNLGN